MAIPFSAPLQTVGNYTNAATSLAANLSTTGTGNLIVVVIGLISNFTPGVTDNKGNIYTMIDQTTSGGIVSFWYAKNISGGTSPVVTATASSTTGISLLVREYSGPMLLDAHVVATGSSANLNSGASKVTGYPSALVIGYGEETIGNPTYTAGSGYGNLGSQQGGAQSISTAIEDQIVTTTGAQTATLTGTSTNWACGVAVFTTRGAFNQNLNALRPAIFKPGLAR